MPKPIIVLKVGYKNFRQVNILGKTVYDHMHLNPNFVNPNPSLVTINNARIKLKEAIEKWGETGNRGAHKDHVEVLFKSKMLHHLLTQLGAWCMSSVDPSLSYEEQTVILTSSGFALKNAKNVQGRLEAVQFFRRIVGRNVKDEQVKLRWKKPLNVTVNTNVKGYTVHRSARPEFSSSIIIAAVPNTVYIDEPGEGIWYYWVVAFNNKGNGVPSETLKVKVAFL